jgi:hypothetical protein
VLHILPIKYLLFSLVVCVAILIYVAPFFGTDESNVTRTAIFVSQSAAKICSGFFVIIIMGWRWFPMVQKYTFPYLGGEWTGELAFESEKIRGTRSIILKINHSLLAINILLESEESSSTTLSCYAQREVAFGRCVLFYIFRNQRKEGTQNSNFSYRGAAIMRIDGLQEIMLHADYFTETLSRGTMVVKRTRKHPFWMLWK